jgi:hypothetical protein
MDALTRELERQVAADPTDGAAAARLARALARAGRHEDARATVRARFAAGEIDADTVALAVEVGSSELEGRPRAAPHANVSYVVSGAARHQTDGLLELAPPVVAFAGVPGAGAFESALALADLLGPRVSDKSELRVDDERVLQFEVELARPWVVARAHAIRAIRVVTIRVALDWVKLRRQLLRSTSALAFVVDARSELVEDVNEHMTNEAAWKALQKDFRRTTGYPVEELPLIFQYHDPVEEAWHRWLTVAVGLRNVPRIVTGIKTSAPEPEPGAPRFSRASDTDRVLAHEGALETFALLLSGVSTAVRGFMTPRTRFAAKPDAGPFSR